MAIELAYAAKVDMTCTLASLASSATAGRTTASESNSTAKSLEALVSGKFKTVAGTPANDKAIYIYAYASVDGGTTYTEGVGGTDAAFTMADPTNLVHVKTVNIPAGNTSYPFGPFALSAEKFGGIMPEKWGFFIRNYTGLALSATGSDNTISYQLVEGA